MQTQTLPSQETYPAIEINKEVFKLVAYQIGLGILLGLIVYLLELLIQQDIKPQIGVACTICGAMCYAMKQETKFPGRLKPYLHTISLKASVAVILISLPFVLAFLLIKSVSQMTGDLEIDKGLFIFVVGIVIVVGGLLNYGGTRGGLMIGISAIAKVRQKQQSM